MLRKLFATNHVPKEQLKEFFEQLAKLDSSDMLGRTKVYCEAASPNQDSKLETLLTVFTQSDSLSLQDVQEKCRGFCQFEQRELLATMSDEFFDRIEDFVDTKAWSLARYAYHFLAPGLKATQEELDRFKALLARLEGYSEHERKEGTFRLIKWVKDSIKDLSDKRAGRELSRAWEASVSQQ